MKSTLLLVTALVGLATPALALPTMIRLGYSECSVCHVTPQGAGLLTEYGKSVDEAQSARASEYVPSESTLVRVLTFNRRIEHDVRLQAQERAELGGRVPTFGEALRVTYRNTTRFTENVRIDFTAGAELPAASPVPSLEYLPQLRMGPAFLGRALWQIRPTDGFELAFGRDYLPTGVNGSDPTLFLRVRNRQSLYDLPLQAKAFIWTEKFLISPYLFGPSLQESVSTDREYGGGVLAERAFAEGTKVLGLSMLGGKSDRLDRYQAGAHARLGFGRWGILAEYAYTYRRAEAYQLHQHASMGQVFFAAQEWLVAYATVQHLQVSAPFAERQIRVKPELGFRLTPNITLGANVTQTFNLLGGPSSTMVGVQLAVKTVN